MANRLGERSWFQYTDEGGRTWATLRDDDLIDNLSDLELAEDGVDYPPLGRFIFPRTTLWEGEDGDTKEVPCTSEYSGYTSNARVTRVLNGVTYTLTGRKGERKTVTGTANGGTTE